MITGRLEPDGEMHGHAARRLAGVPSLPAGTLGDYYPPCCLCGAALTAEGVLVCAGAAQAACDEKMRRWQPAGLRPVLQGGCGE